MATFNGKWLGIYSLHGSDGFRPHCRVAHSNLHFSASFLPNVPLTDTELGKPRKQSWKIHPTFPVLQSVLQVPNQRRYLFDREIIQPELHSHVWVGFREPGKQCLKMFERYLCVEGSYLLEN